MDLPCTTYLFLIAEEISSTYKKVRVSANADISLEGLFDFIKNLSFRPNSSSILKILNVPVAPNIKKTIGDTNNNANTIFVKTKYFFTKPP